MRRGEVFDVAPQNWREKWISPASVPIVAGDKLGGVQPKVVLVTGGSGVIGAAIAHELSDSNRREPFRVVVNYARDVERAEELQREIGCDLVRADVGDEEAVASMFGGLPPLYGVVHAAAIARDGLLLRTSVEAWRDVLRVDLDGAFLVARAALNQIEDGGRLIFLSSRVGERGGIGQCSYAAAKAGVVALMRVAAREGAARGIAVNAIMPALIASSMTGALDLTALENHQSRSILGRNGDARTVAATVRWLLDADDVSGQVIHCDNRMEIDGGLGALLSLDLDEEY